MYIGNIDLLLVAIIGGLCVFVAGGALVESFRKPLQAQRRNDPQGRPLPSPREVRDRLARLGVLPSRPE